VGDVSSAVQKVSAKNDRSVDISRRINSDPVNNSRGLECPRIETLVTESTRSNEFGSCQPSPIRTEIASNLGFGAVSMSSQDGVSFVFIVSIKAIEIVLRSSSDE